MAGDETVYHLRRLLIFSYIYLYKAMSTFETVNEANSPDKPHVKKWLENYEKGCGKKLEMTYALQNASLNGCGYIVIFTSCYFFYIYRYAWCCACLRRTTVAEGNIMCDSFCLRIMVATYRLLITVAMAAPFGYNLAT